MSLFSPDLGILPKLKPVLISIVHDNEYFNITMHCFISNATEIKYYKAISTPRKEQRFWCTLT